MSLKQHINPRIRFEQQVNNSRAYVLPFIEQTKELKEGTTVLEIGCGEGGVLLPFVEKNCLCTGVDLAPQRIDLANEFLYREVQSGRMEFICQNVYEDSFLKKYEGFFDLIILKDAIEHIPEQEKFIPYICKFLKAGGQIYFGFPPWYMPFGGHQQICKSKIASMLPYYHILPTPLYKGMLRLFGEHPAVIRDLIEVKETQITIERFEKIIRNSGLKVLNKQHYLINPIYRYKFGLKARKQLGLITKIPFIRNFLTTCVYYTVG